MALLSMRQNQQASPDPELPARATRRLPFKRWLRRQRHWFVILAVLSGVFLAYVLAGTKYLGSDWLKLNKDALAGLQSVTQIVILIAAAVLSYDRFFRGRTSVSRAELALCVKVIDSTDDCLVHMIELRFKNIGTKTIWYPVPQLTRRSLSFENGDTKLTRKYVVPIYSNHVHANEVVDSGETVMFCTVAKLPIAICAAHYEATVEDEEKLLWYATAVIANKQP